MGQSHAVSRGPHQTARAEEGEGCRHAVKEFVRHSTNEPRVKRATKKDGRVCARTFFCVCVFVFVFLCRKKPYARVPGHFHSIPPSLPISGGCVEDRRKAGGWERPP